MQKEITELRNQVLNMKKLIPMFFVCLVISFLPGCGNSCGCNGETSIEIDGKVLRIRRGTAQLVSQSQMRSDFSGVRGAKQNYYFECSRIRCESGGVSLYSGDGELLFSHKGTYNLNPTVKWKGF